MDEIWHYEWYIKDCTGNQSRITSAVFVVAVYVGFKGDGRFMVWKRETEMTKYLVISVVVNVNAALAVDSFLFLSLFLSSLFLFSTS